MSQNSSANVFDNIQSICREYRKRLKAGETLRLSDYLMRIEDSARETLFQNLLHLEIEFSRRQGESPSSEAYINRFPQFARLIRQAFFESTMMSQEYFGDTPDSAEPTVTLGIPAARKIGEYELLRELGRGGFGVVYEAKHLQRGDRLALKTLPNMARGSSLSSSDAERLHKFRREFRTLSEINHPNLAGMQTLEFDGDQWFFTMDLVDGVDFLDYVRPEGKFDESRLRRTAKQLARGVAALHDQGIVHRDLKPSNVLVDAAGHVTILDFGLVAELQQATDQTLSAQTKHFAGTPRYAAPEQADGNRNAACDWYALGVMFYEAITGTAPYSGSGVNLLLKKKSEDASSLAGREGLPNDLANLVDQLLRRNPQERPNFTAIADVLELASESTAQDSADTEQPTYSIDADTLLIGRESQLHSLDQAWMQVQERSEPGVVFVSGLSGEGKTTLVKRFLSEIRRSGGTLVLSGRCYDRESVPFKAVDSLIDALVAFLRSRSGEELGKWMPGDSHLLAHLFPSLRRVSSIEDRLNHDFGGISDRQLRYRAFFALKELLRGISRRMPIVLFVDDLQWGDGDSAEVLCGLLSPPDPLPILLVGTFRSDEVDDSSFLKEWRKLNESGGSTFELTQVPVEPLTQDQCVELVSSRIGVDVARLRERAKELFSDTRGNPYFLEQLIEGFDAATERFDPIPLDQMIARKLERLPDQSSALLESIAVAGQAVALSEAADVCQRPANAFSIVTHMRSEQLVRLIGSGDRQLVDTYHDKIRESVLEGLDDSREKKLHLRFGELLEASENISAKKVLQFLGEYSTDEEAMEPFTTDRIFDLAYHFWAAGDARGTAYQLMAGELSYRAYASEDVVDFLKRAQDSLDETVPDTVRFRFWERLASSSARLHQFDTALKYYDHALQYANSSDARARVRLGIARIHQFLGHYMDSTANFDHVLDEFGVRRPGVLGVMWRSPTLAVKVFLIPRRWQRTSDVAQVNIASWEQKVYSSFCFHVFEVHHPIHYVYAMLRQASSAIRTGQSQRISLGLTELGGHLAFSGLVGIGQRMIERASDPANDSDGDEATGKRLLYGGYALACSGQFERANAQYCEAIPVLIKCGLHTEAYICAHFQRHLHAVMSNTTLELQSARQVFRLAEESGNVQGRLWGRYDMAVAFARAGDLQSAADWIEQGRVCKGDNKMMATGVVFLAAQGFVHLQSSNYESARLVLEESWQTTAKQKVVNEYIVQALPWLIESYAGPNWLDDSRTPPMKRLRLLCQQAWVFLWLYPNLKPQIERARGRVYAALGKRKKAMRCLERSVRFAAKIGADYDLAKASLDLAAVKEEGRREMRSEAIRLLKKQESVIPYAESWLLGDQYDPDVVAGPREEERDDGSLHGRSESQ